VNDTAAERPDAGSLTIFDAGPAVGFSAANQLPLLIEVFERVRFTRTVPFVVDREVRRQDKKYSGVAKRWNAAVVSHRIEVLEEVAVGRGDQRVALEVARMRDMDLADALRNQRDLGEVLTVAHAVVARNDGLTVAVSIDDSYGARLADIARIQNIDSVKILELAIKLEIIPSKKDLQKIYTALQKYSSLPNLNGTGLLKLKFST
jgi:predicted nucleic acid-binding protein